MKTPEQIINFVADQYEVKASDLTGMSKERIHTEPRQVAMYLIYKYCDLNGPKTGALFGKTQSNIVFANNKVVDIMSVNRRFSSRINDAVINMGL
jgi:chromosomal replication initiation ATPase DnaA